MILDLTVIAQSLALAGCALLLILWVLYSRRLVGFLLMCTGWALLIVAYRSNGNMEQLKAQTIIVCVISVFVLLLYALWRTRRRRVPVYRPLPKD